MILSEQYGADTLRLYEMFLGPIEQSKPWNTNGIEGVFRFLGKLWRLFHDQEGASLLTDDKATPEELRALHTAIKKITEDMQSFSLNTSVSAFMICVNDLSKEKCGKRSILEKLVVLMAPFTPHISEELWQALGHQASVHDAEFPEFDESLLVQNSYSYPVSVNGKMKFLLELPMNASKEDIEKQVLATPQCQKILDGKQLKKIIVVPQKIVNLVIT